MEGSCGCVLWAVSVARAAPSYPEAERCCGEESTLRRGVGTGNGVGSWLQIPTQLFTLCVNLGKLIGLFLLYFHHL